MASIGSRIIPNFKRAYWTGKSEVYPIAACLGLAVAWCGFMSTRSLFANPDVSLTASRRANLLREEVADEAESWVSHRRMHIAKDVSDIRIFGGSGRRYE